jgi:hypothetical protein
LWRGSVVCVGMQGWLVFSASRMFSCPDLLASLATA